MRSRDKPASRHVGPRMFVAGIIFVASLASTTVVTTASASEIYCSISFHWKFSTANGAPTSIKPWPNDGEGRTQVETTLANQSCVTIGCDFVCVGEPTLLQTGSTGGSWWGTCEAFSVVVDSGTGFVFSHIAPRTWIVSGFGGPWWKGDGLFVRDPPSGIAVAPNEVALTGSQDLWRCDVTSGTSTMVWTGY